jgi:hypothetical protein
MHHYWCREGSVPGIIKDRTLSRSRLLGFKVSRCSGFPQQLQVAPIYGSAQTSKPTQHGLGNASRRQACLSTDNRTNGREHRSCSRPRPGQVQSRAVVGPCGATQPHSNLLQIGEIATTVFTQRGCSAFVIHSPWMAPGRERKRRQDPRAGVYIRPSGQKRFFSGGTW